MLKYGSSEEKMLEFLNNATCELEKITFSDKRILELSDLLDASTERLVSIAEKLTNSRKKAAKNFEINVSSVLEYLNMPNVKFVVNLQKGRYTKYGPDTCEFLISANQGENPKPLHKIASGGELSRVMLSIKSALLDKDTVGTMIFDEIDTGISGFAAGKVGTQLKKVSKNRQVICVTHLAQIAAIADEHLLISKSANNGRTFTENLYNSAKELIDRSNQI